jgi:hypothetical protein
LVACQAPNKNKILFWFSDYATLKICACLDSDTAEVLAEEVSKYHLPDFSDWKNHDAFERTFARLEKNCAPTSARRHRRQRLISGDYPAGSSFG